MQKEVGAKLKISGKVQGVWYRASTAEKAVELGLNGWVKNMADGTVEAFAQGPKPNVEALIGWCWEGPRLAEVTDVQVTWMEPDAGYREFEVRY